MSAMRRRSSTPVLYELMKRDDRSRHPQVGASRPAESPMPGPMVGGAEAPRRAVRVPIGWLWLAGCVALAAAVLAYTLGHARGERSGFAQGEASLRERSAQDLLDRAVADPAATPRGEAPAGGSAAGARGAAGSQESGQDAGSRTPPAPRPPGVDPRTKGWTYIVVAHLPPTEADALVSFLLASGLDAAAISDNNARLRKVVALPGYPEGTSQSESLKRLMSKVKATGEKWKNAARGHRDFSDAYPELCR